MSVAPHPHPQKARRGLHRLAWATRYSIEGLWAALRLSSAFRLETGLTALGVPLAFALGQSAVEVILLCAVLVLLLVVELLNSGIEAAIDRIGHEIHPLSKLAKDLGSAAVFLCSLLCAGVWLGLLGPRLGGLL